MTEHKNIIFNLAFIGLSLLVLQVYSLLHGKELTMAKAVDPVHHLSNAYHAIVNDDYNKSLYEMEEAIMAMKIIERYSNTKAKNHIDDAIRELTHVEREIASDSLNMSDLNHAFFNALNSIAFANLTISEESLDKGEHYKAMRLLNASFREMISSIKFADTLQREQEDKVIKNVRHILNKLVETNFEATFDYDSLNNALEELISK